MSPFSDEFLVHRRRGTQIAGYAAPVGGGGGSISISGVSGSVGQGNTLTATGSLLLNRQTANDSPFLAANSNRWSFEGTAPYGGGGDGFTQPGGDPAAGCTVNYSSSVKLFGSKSLYMNSVGTGGASSEGQASIHVSPAYVGGGNDEYWFRMYCRYAPVTNFPNMYMKLLYDFNNAYYVDGKGSGTTAFEHFTGKWGSDSFDIPNPSSFSHLSDRSNRWILFEWHIATASAPGGAIYEAWIENELCYSSTAVTGPDLPMGLMLLGVTNAQATIGFGTWDFENWIDGIQFSSVGRLGAPCLIELANSATYASATKRYQAPESISDSSVGFTCDLTGLGGGPYHLFITNDNGERSAAFAL